MYSNIRPEDYKWDTQFETAQNLMIHTFENGVIITSNIKTGEIKAERDNRVIDRRYQDMPIGAYTDYLITAMLNPVELSHFAI